MRHIITIRENETDKVALRVDMHHTLMHPMHVHRPQLRHRTMQPLAVEYDLQARRGYRKNLIPRLAARGKEGALGLGAGFEGDAVGIQVQPEGGVVERRKQHGGLV
jgi:hypothetical protein